MIRFALQRFASLLATLVVASVIVFAAMEVVPGDAASFMLGMNASPETVAALRAELGLEGTPAERYLEWVGGLLVGDFGISYTYRTPVGDMIAERLLVSMPLALLALGLSMAIAFPVGSLTAARRGYVPRRSSRVSAKTLLEVEGLVREHAAPRRTLLAPRQTQRVLDGVSFSLNAGESLGLVGESGCGKSTLARAVLGLEPLQGGRVLLEGEPIVPGRQTRPGFRRRIQGVFQDPYGSFNSRHRVGRLVAEPFHLFQDSPRGAARRRAVDEVLEAVGLRSSNSGKYIHEFSGGQRQRIAIARALLIRPKLIVLDEAVSALDVVIRAQVLDLLADLSDRFSLSYLFISHDLSVVRAIADRVLVMRSGSIVEEGATETIFTSPKHAYTRALLDAVPRFERIA